MRHRVVDLVRIGLGRIAVRRDGVAERLVEGGRLCREVGRRQADAVERR